MATLTAPQKKQVAQFWSLFNFNATTVANFNLDDIVAAVTALDNAFDTTLTNAVAAVGGNTTVINGLAATLPSPFSGATNQQKINLLTNVLQKRAGLI